MEQLKEILQSDMLIPILAFFSVIGIGASILLARKGHGSKALESRLEDHDWSASGLEASQEKSGFFKLVEKIGNFASHGQASTTLWEQLVQAGHFNSKAPAIYTGTKMLLFCVGMAGSAIGLMPLDISFTSKMMMISASGAVLFFIPNLVLMQQRKTRRDEIWHRPEYGLEHGCQRNSAG
ncbi:MAG: hypothetical protein ACYS8Z_18765 [Planctomycetota bacterium]